MSIPLPPYETTFTPLVSGLHRDPSLETLGRPRTREGDFDKTAFRDWETRRLLVPSGFTETPVRGFTETSVKGFTETPVKGQENY